MNNTLKQLQIYDREALKRGDKLRLLRGAVIPIDKPIDWSSFDVVKYFRLAVKRATGIKKIKTGHAGTLDPKATGLLLLCTGRATKQIELLMNHDKEYLASLKLGATTPSYDSEHAEDATFPWEHISKDLFCDVLKKFEGDIMQVPPLFSAISIDGKRAYKFARKGREISLPAKPITIHGIELIDFAPPYANIKVHCGRATYIRSLARDIGESLNSGAYLTALRRNSVGSFSVDTAFQVEELASLLNNADLSIEEE